MALAPIDIGLGLEGTHVMVTGGAGMIGSVVVSAFLSAGARVSVLDVSRDKLTVLENSTGLFNSRDAAAASTTSASDSATPALSSLWCELADISDEAQLQAAWSRAEHAFGPVTCCVALAGLDLSVLAHHAGGIADMSLAQWERTLKVNVTGTFLTAREWVRRLKAHQQTMTAPHLRNRGLIIVGSESGLFGERMNADYATGKSAVQGGLLASLKADVPRTLGPGARVNAVAPGPVDTPQFRRECEANPDQFYADARGTVALGRPVEVECVARSILYLASEKYSGNVHGTLLKVDSGKEGKLMWRENE